MITALYIYAALLLLATITAMVVTADEIDEWTTAIAKAEESREPTPEEIKAGCLEIQAGWSERERWIREGGLRKREYEFPQSKSGIARRNGEAV